MIAQLARTLVPAAISLVVAVSLQNANAAPAGNSAPASVAARTHDVFTDGQRQARFDTFSEGAHNRGAAALVAGLDRSEVSATPRRKFDPYTDGARALEGDPRPRGTALQGTSAWV
ncbi:LysR family transcriptional regulator [Cupriavidus necator]|uniref:LysR family transcriptional regulator n=1 Tax=Cupriavidus necator TaxID=106590 RepID=UPI0039C0B8A7